MRRLPIESFIHVRELNPARAVVLDAKLDKVLSLLDQTLEGFVELGGGVHAETAKKVRDAVFPDGRPFVEQHELLNLLRKLRTDEIARALSLLQLDFWVGRLEQLNAEHSAALTRPERVEVETVRAPDTTAWVAHVEAVAAVVAAATRPLRSGTGPVRTRRPRGMARYGPRGRPRALPGALSGAG